MLIDFNSIKFIEFNRVSMRCIPHILGVDDFFYQEKPISTMFKFFS
ncbi:hypothetical protein APS_0680 [Acetobacter pasteurianus subsp. pasteurianus LMG 1262 = NBRC 106471]|nr:hypothetical protein APS_0680 [Acetobacter pasteurianus subsp. pasteurianus LMG 1262 = NBRC 106471]